MKSILFFLFLSSSVFFYAQELNCEVSIQSNPALDITTREKEIFKELEQAVFELINNTTWTDDDYEVEERINCTFQFSIVKVRGQDSYEAQLQVQATRPVYNSSYNTTLLNFLDKNVVFTYRQGERIIYSPNQFSGNLSSVIAFYVYYILGLDGDSFALKGGDPYFKKAQSIVMLAQSSMGKGWQADSKTRRNRYWLIENQLQELFEPVRECSYIYHRKGLDNMFEAPKTARENIVEALTKLKKASQSRPGSVNVLNFAEAKKDEIIGIFKDANGEMKRKVVELMKRIDPTNTSEYNQLLF